MKIQVSQSSKKSSKNKSENSINKAWSRLNTEKKKLKKFHQVMDSLVLDYQNKWIEFEKEGLPGSIALAGKLIVFFGRKSLSNYHREELAEWIRELIDDVRELNFESGQELTTKFMEQLAKLEGLTPEELEETLNEAQKEFEEALAKAEHEDWEEEDDEDLFDPFEQDDLFGFDDFDLASDEKSSDKPDEESSQFLNDAEPGSVETDEQWVRQLFRKTAKLLHPDKELDPKMKDLKHEAMSKLLKAREDDDLATIVELYSEFGSDNTLSLNPQEAEVLVGHLQRQVDDLKIEYSNCIEQSPVYHKVYHLFYATTEKGRKSRAEEFKKRERGHQAAVKGLTEDVRNLKDLKLVLNERAEVMHLDMMSSMWD